MTTSTSTTQQTRAIVVGMYDAIVAGDFAAVMGLLADDIVVREPGYLPYGGTYQGLEEFQALIGKGPCSTST